MSLVSSSSSAEFVERLKTEYYTDERLSQAGKCRAHIDDVVFESKAGLGSSFVEF